MQRSRFDSLLPDRAIKNSLAYVAGCGNLGSHISLGLAKMGVENFILIDPDTVGEENLSTQLYRLADINNTKPRSLQALLQLQAGLWPRNFVCCTRALGTKDDGALVYSYWNLGCRLPRGETGPNIILAVTDNIESRRSAFARLFLETNTKQKGPRLFVDVRMGAEYLEAHFIKAEQGFLFTDPYQEEYFDWISDLEQTFIPEPCSAKSIAYTGMLAAGLVCAQIRRWLINSTIPKAIHFDCGNGDILYRWRDGESYQENPHQETDLVEKEEETEPVEPYFDDDEFSWDPMVTEDREDTQVPREGTYP